MVKFLKVRDIPRHRPGGSCDDETSATPVSRRRSVALRLIFLDSQAKERLPSPRSRPPDIAADDPLPPLPLRPTRSWCSFRAAMRARRLSSSRTMTRAPPPAPTVTPSCAVSRPTLEGENHGHGGVLAGAARGSTGRPAPPIVFARRDHRRVPDLRLSVASSRRVASVARVRDRAMARGKPYFPVPQWGRFRLAALGGALTILPSPSQPSR